MRIIRILPAGRMLALAVCLASTGARLPAGESGTPWETARFEAAPQVFSAPAEVSVPEGVKAVLFEGPPFRGRPTRVFAYYGLPAAAVSGAKAPGIVLVHGAGGTAFSDWVRLWVGRGYAAIAFDNDAGLPAGTYNAWARNPEAGPRRGDIAQLDRPVEDQWMYHAVADTMLAHSLLASFPEVDAGRIGATGISWGGVVVCNAAAVDPRLKFAAPVYGCGFISDESDDGSCFVGQKGTVEQRAAWRALWDPANFLPRARTPFLWVSGSNDFAFTMKAWRQSYRAAPGTRAISLRVRMPHGHGGPGESPEEIRAFADGVVGEGARLVRIGAQGHDQSRVWAGYDSPTSLKRAELNFTRSSGRWQERVWETTPAEIERDRIVADLPAGATTYFFNLIDDRNLVISTGHVDLGP